MIVNICDNRLEKSRERKGQVSIGTYPKTDQYFTGKYASMPITDARLYTTSLELIILVDNSN